MMADVTIAVYALFGATFAALHVYGVRQPDRMPSLGRLLSFLMESRFGRWALLFGWWWLGWHFFVRRHR